MKDARPAAILGRFSINYSPTFIGLVTDHLLMWTSIHSQAAMLTEIIDKIVRKLYNIDYLTLGLILGTALVCALIVYCRKVKDRSVRDFFDFMFPEEIILHPSRAPTPCSGSPSG